MKTIQLKITFNSTKVNRIETYQEDWNEFKQQLEKYQFQYFHCTSDFAFTLHSCEKKRIYYARLHTDAAILTNVNGKMPQCEWMSLTNFLSNWFVYWDVNKGSSLHFPPAFIRTKWFTKICLECASIRTILHRTQNALKPKRIKFNQLSMLCVGNFCVFLS